MDILTTTQLLQICGLKQAASIKCYLKDKNAKIPEYIKYLKSNNLLMDILCEAIDKKETKWLYEDLLFISMKKSEFLIYGYYFSNYNTAKELKITPEEHNHNIKNINLSDISIDCINLSNMTFNSCPFTNIKIDSRLIAIIIKNKFRLNPILLLEDILWHNNIYYTCNKCNNITKIKYQHKLNLNRRLSEVQFCSDCQSTTHLKTLRSNFAIPNISKTNNTSYYIKHMFDLVCPFCDIKFDNNRQFAIHLAKHGTNIFEFLTKYCKHDNENSICPVCNSNTKTIKGEYRKYFQYDYYTTLNDIFYDYDIVNDFSIYGDTCKDCHHKSLLVSVKKIYSFMNKRKDNLSDKYLQSLEEIRYHYHDIDKYRIPVNNLLNLIREYTTIRTVEYKELIFDVYSKTEEKIFKKIIDNPYTSNIYINWDIPNEIGGIFYNDDRLYVPDIFFTYKNKQYILEVKSDYTLKKDFNTNIDKFNTAIQFCKERNMKFLIYVDTYGILSVEKILEVFSE